MNLLIRDYQTNDALSCLDLVQSNTPAYFVQEEWNDFKKYLELEREDYYVVELDNQVIACGGINYQNHGATAVFSWDVVHPAFQGQSIGKQLLQYRLQKVKTNPGINQLIVRTSQLVYRFYEQFGFKLVITEKAYWAPNLDLYFMQYSTADFPKPAAAQLQLMELMQTISERCYYATWIKNLEYVLWDALKNGPLNYGHDQVTNQDIQQLQALAITGDAWVYFDEQTEEQIINLAAWEMKFAHHSMTNPRLLLG